MGQRPVVKPDLARRVLAFVRDVIISRQRNEDVLALPRAPQDRGIYGRGASALPQAETATHAVKAGRSTRAKGLEVKHVLVARTPTRLVGHGWRAGWWRAVVMERRGREIKELCRMDSSRPLT